METVNSNLKTQNKKLIELVSLWRQLASETKERADKCSKELSLTIKLATEFMNKIKELEKENKQLKERPEYLAQQIKEKCNEIKALLEENKKLKELNYN